MPRPRFRDDQWERIYAIWRACPGIDVAQEPGRPAASSRRWSGWRGRAARGGWCRMRSAAGTVCAGGSHAGRRRVSGRRCWSIWRPMPTANGCCSTAPWCGPMPAPPGQKKRRRARAQQLLQQAARSRRRPWQPAGLPPDRSRATPRTPCPGSTAARPRQRSPTRPTPPTRSLRPSRPAAPWR